MIEWEYKDIIVNLSDNIEDEIKSIIYNYDLIVSVSNRRIFDYEDIERLLNYSIGLFKSDESSLCDSYYNYLSDNNEINEDLVVYQYMNNDELFISWLHDKESTTDIVNSINNQERFNLYNKIINEIFIYFSNMGLDVIKVNNNIVDYGSRVCKKTYKKIYNSVLFGNDLECSTRLSKDNLFILFESFLESIDAPSKWYSYYKDLREYDLEFIKNKMDCSGVYIDKKNECLKMKMNDTERLDMFTIFVHEFCHYVSGRNGLDVNDFLIGEISSIYFERIAEEFLEDCGVSKDVADSTLYFRDYNNSNNLSKMMPIFVDFLIFKNNGYVLESDKIEYFNKRKYNNVRENVYKQVDEFNKNYIEYGVGGIGEFRYLLDSYISYEVLDSSNIREMFYLTEELHRLDFEDIVDRFNLVDVFNRDNKVLRK